MPIRVKYGLSVLLELAEQGKVSPVQSRLLSKKCGIPHQFLEQVLLRLKQAGIIKSFRGAQGGYILNKLVEDITVLEIIKVLEGEKSIAEGYSGGNTLKLFWSNIEKDIQKIFKVSLKVILENKQKEEKMLNYHI